MNKQEAVDCLFDQWHYGHSYCCSGCDCHVELADVLITLDLTEEFSQLEKEHGYLSLWVKTNVLIDIKKEKINELG